MESKTRWGALFVVTRDPEREGGTVIAFHDGADGRRTASLPLDPLELVPYDAARYARVSRERCSLVIGPGSYGSGSLLDTWARIRYDVATHALLLATHRPTAGPYVERGHLVCRVERRWVEVTLASQRRRGRALRAGTASLPRIGMPCRFGLASIARVRDVFRSPRGPKVQP